MSLFRDPSHMYLLFYWQTTAVGAGYNLDDDEGLRMRDDDWEVVCNFFLDNLLQSRFWRILVFRVFLRIVQMTHYTAYHAICLTCVDPTIGPIGPQVRRSCPRDCGCGGISPSKIRGQRSRCWSRACSRACAPPSISSAHWPNGATAAC